MGIMFWVDMQVTLSKYCRQSGINLIGLSKDSGLSLKAIRFMYKTNIVQFEKFVKKWG